MPIVNVYSTSVTSDNISRFELLAWVNDCLQSNLTKIEEMASGAAYCQLTDFLIPNHVQLKKVKWNSRQEVDWMNNWRVLQHAWKEIGIDRPVPVQNLMRAKFQDNFEFLQWFKRLFDANYDGHEYDPQAARNFEEFPAALPAGANRRKMPAAAPPLARTTTVTSTTSRRSMFGTGPSAGRPQSATTTRKPPIPSSRLSIMPKGPTAVAAGARAQDGASDRKMNGAQGTTTTTRGRQSIGVKKLTSNAAEKTTTTANTTLLEVASPRRRVTSSSASSSATITKKQEQRPIASPRQQAEAQKRNGQQPQQKLQQKEYEKQIVELQAQVNELRHQLEFTNGKLAQIEALCAAAKPGASVSVEQLQQIILDRNMFVGKSGGQNIDGQGNASSPEPRGDAIPPPLDSPDERQLHELMGIAAAAANMNTGKSTTSENTTDQLVTQIGGEGDASVVVGEGDGRQVQAAAAKSEAQNSSTQQQNTSMGADLMDMDTAHLEDAFLDLSMGSAANTSNNDGLRQLLFSNNSEGGNVGSDVAPVAVLLPEQPHEEQQEEEMRQSLLNNTFDIVPGEHNEEEELINVTHPVVSENEQALLEITHLTNGADISNMVAPPEEEENILNTTYDTERTADQGFTHMMDSDNGTPMTEGGGDGSATGVNQAADLSGEFISSTGTS